MSATSGSPITPPSCYTAANKIRTCLFLKLFEKCWAICCLQFFSSILNAARKPITKHLYKILYMNIVKYRLQNFINNYFSVAAGFKMAFCSPCGWYTCTKTCWRCHFNNVFIKIVHFIGVINSILMYQTYLHGKIRRTSESLYGSMHTAQHSPSPWISCKQGQKFLINFNVTRFHFERTFCAFLHTYILTYIHTYIYTYIHTHIIHIYLFIFNLLSQICDSGHVKHNIAIYIKLNIVNNINILQHKH